MIVAQTSCNSFYGNPQKQQRATLLTTLLQLFMFDSAAFDWHIHNTRMYISAEWWREKGAKNSYVCLCNWVKRNRTSSLYLVNVKTFLISYSLLWFWLDFIRQVECQETTIAKKPQNGGFPTAKWQNGGNDKFSSWNSFWQNFATFGGKKVPGTTYYLKSLKKLLYLFEAFLTHIVVENNYILYNNY